MKLDNLIKCHARSLFSPLFLMCSSNTNDDPGQALSAAKQLASEGKYREALEKHIWFHDHALEIEPAYYEVRLSFALGYWVQLGEKFPPALTALQEIRDNKQTRLLKEPDRNLFNDVEAINSHLDDHQATVVLFKKLDDTHTQFAASVYDLAQEALIAAGEFALAKKHIGNPLKRFENAKRDYESQLSWLEEEPNRESMQNAYQQIFAEEVVRIITVLDKTGDRSVGREIRDKALVVLDSPVIKAALIE